MYLFFSIFVFLVVSQLIVGIYALILKKSLPKKYKYYLSSQIEFHKILESFKTQNNSLQILVTDQLDDVCIAEENLIIVNKRSVYAKDMYSIIYLLFQLELTNPKYKRILHIYNYQSLLFVLQILLGLAFLILPQFGSIILIIAGIVLLLNIIVTVYGVSIYRMCLENVYYFCKKELKIDKVERARIENLIGEIKYELLRYPLEIPWRFKRFWSV